MRPTLQTVADAVGVSRSTVSNAYSRPDQLSPELRERILDAATSRSATPGPTRPPGRCAGGRAGADRHAVHLQPVVRVHRPVRGAVPARPGGGGRTARTGLLLLPLSADDEPAAVAAVNERRGRRLLRLLPARLAPGAGRRIQARGLPVVSGQRRAGDGPTVALRRHRRGGGDPGRRAAPDRRSGTGGSRSSATTSLTRRRSGRSTLRTPDDVGLLHQPGAAARLPGGFRATAGVDWADVTTVNVHGNSREAAAAAAAPARPGAAADRDRRRSATSSRSASSTPCGARGLRPGQDVSVIGFDDIPEAAAASLTTVRQPAADRGRLLRRTAARPTRRSGRPHRRAAHRLVVRATTGPAPS